MPVFHRLTSLLAAVALTAALAVPALAHDYRQGGLHIEHPWARPSIGQVPNGAVYLTITNSGAESDVLEGAKGELSRAVELHSHSHDNGVMRMRRLGEGVEIPAGETVKIAPGGLHIMLLGLKEPLVEGRRYPLTLIFRKTGEVPVEIAVEKAPGHEGGGHH